MPFTIGERDYINTTAKQQFANQGTGFDKDAGSFTSRTTDLFNNTWSGLSHNTFFTNLIGLTQKEKFEAEEGYNPFEDQDIKMFNFDMNPFIHSQSKAQSKAIANHILYRSKMANSPAYVMGSFLGYLFDPSTLLLGYGKIPQALMKGSLARKTGKFMGVNSIEEAIKQQNDPARTDFESYMTIGASAVIPSIFQGLKHLGNTRDNTKTIFEYNLIKDYSEKATRSSKIKNDVVDATFKDVDDVLQIESKFIDDTVDIVDDFSKGRGTFFRGEGGGRFKVEAVGGNVFGDALYLAPTKSVAKFHGKNIKTINVNLKNPLILKTDKDLNNILITAGIKPMVEGVLDPPTKSFAGIKGKGKHKFLEFDKGTTKESLDQLKKWLINNQYDGVVVDIGRRTGTKADFNKISAIKEKGHLTLAKLFSHDQIISFQTKTKTQKENIDTIIVNDLKKFAPETLEAESTVGAQQIPKGKNIKKEIEGEKIQPTGLGIFGEKSQFTPIFDVLNNSLLLSDKKMITRLTHTPLAQMKNTKEFGFEASEKSIDVEADMFMHSHRLKHIMTTYDLYAKYLKRVANKDIKFNEQLFFAGNKKKGIIGFNEFRNAIGMQLFYGAKDFKPNINGLTISVPEIQEGARAAREFIYSPVGAMADEYKMFSIIPEKELLFWDEIRKVVIKKAKKTGDATIEFESKLNPGEVKVFTLDEIIAKVESLQRRINHLDKYGGLRENYVNRIWNKVAIEKDVEGFKRAILQALEPDQKIDINAFVQDILEQKPYIRAHTAQGNDADMFIFQSPRYSRNVRNRTLKMKDYQLAEQGFLELDVFGLADIYMRHMVPDLFITKYFGDPNAMGFRVARGTNEEGMLKSDDVFYEDGLIQIRDQYEKLISKAKTNKQQKEIRALEKRMLKKLEDSRDLVKGFYGVSETPYSAFSTGIKSAKVINNIVNLTGLAQIADVGRTVMMNGLTRTFGGMMDGWEKGMMNFRANGLKEGQTVGEALDMYFSNRASQLGNTQDLFSNFSSRPDAILGRVENFTFKYVNLMSFWNQEMKGFYSSLASSRISDVSLKWALQEGKIDLGGRKLAPFFTEKATDVELKNLATLGIDLDKAVRIAREVLRVSEFGKYNIITKKDLWTDNIALDSLNYALKKDINIGIVTPGKGDTPLWMSTELGGLVSQYKKFAMGASQRVLMRGLQDSDSKFLMGLIMMTAIGMLIDKIRTEQYGQDYDKKSAVAKLTDGIDRSGVTGIFFDINNSVERMFHNRVGLRPLLGTNNPYGSDLADQLGVVGGPNVGLIDKVFNIMYDVGSGGYDQHTASNVRRILPWQNVWYLDWLFDQAEEGMK